MAEMSCTAVSLFELSELALVMVLESPQFVMAVDFNSHAEAISSAVAQGFMMTMGLSQMVYGLTYVVLHTLDLPFCTRQNGKYLGIEKLSGVLLS